MALKERDKESGVQQAHLGLIWSQKFSQAQGNHRHRCKTSARWKYGGDI